jgi:hypothetical protein
MKYRIYRDTTWLPTMGIHNFNARLVVESEREMKPFSCFALGEVLDTLKDEDKDIHEGDIIALEAGGAWMLDMDTRNWMPVDMRKIQHVDGINVERADIALAEDITKYSVTDDHGEEHLVRVEHVPTYVCHQHGYQCAGTRAVRHRARRQHS